MISTVSYGKKIKTNAAQCKICGEVVESKHRHDYQRCKCEEIMVDGGHDYLRGGARHMENFLPRYSMVSYYEVVNG